MINSFTTGWSILQENCIRGEIIFCLIKLATFTWFPEIVYLQDFLSDFHIVGREVVEGRQLKLGFASVTLLCCVMPAPDHQFLTISRKHFVLNSMSSSYITPMGTDFMTCLCCRWSTCGPRPPSSHQSRATHQPARMALLAAQWRPITWAPFLEWATNGTTIMATVQWGARCPPRSRSCISTEGEVGTHLDSNTLIVPPSKDFR